MICQNIKEYKRKSAPLFARNVKHGKGEMPSTE